MVTNTNDAHTPEKIELRDIEQNVIMRFSKKLEKLASQRKLSSYAGSALGSQDTVFADYLLATDTRFCLIEFKARRANISSENQKSLRIDLFKHLSQDKSTLSRSLVVHYMCWGTIESYNVPGLDELADREGEILSQYAPCVAPYMPVKPKLKKPREYLPEEFIGHFFDSRLVGSNLTRFKRYIEELAELAADSKEDGSTLQGMVCLFVPDLGVFDNLRFTGITHLMRLMNSPQQVYRQEESNSFEPKGLGR